MSANRHNERPHYDDEKTDDLPSTEIAEPEQENSFEKMLAEYVEKHGAESPRLIKLSQRYHAEKSNKINAEVTNKRKISRRGILKIMGGAISGIGLLATGAYTGGKYVKDSAEKAAEDAAEKRINSIKEDFKKWQQIFSKTAFDLMDEMFKFIKLFKKTERWISAGNAAVKGALGDLTDYLFNRDKHPDHIKKSFEDMINNDPELLNSYKKIHNFSEQLKTHIENFGKMVDDTTDWKIQRDKFMEDFFKSFTDHLLGD